MKRDISRGLGAVVLAIYPATDPASPARADPFRASWSDVLGLLWIGSGFMPFWPRADGSLQRTQA